MKEQNEMKGREKRKNEKKRRSGEKKKVKDNTWPSQC